MRKFKITVIFTDGRMAERLFFLDCDLQFATTWARKFYACDAYTSITVESVS